MIKFKISILYPIFNNLFYTKLYLPKLIECIKSGYDSKNYSIIIIDDGSSDGSSAWIKINYPETHLLKGDGNLWWSGAINLGAKYAIEVLQSDYVLLWNNDVYPEKNYFKIIASLIENDNRNIIIGSKVLVSGTNEIWSVGGYLNRYTGAYNMLKNYERGRSKINWQPGMGTLIHKDIIIKNNYWDNKSFPQYHGDSDFCLRACNKGIDIVTCTDLILYNDQTNTGFQIITLKDYFKALRGLKSNLDISKMFIFYCRHTIGPLPFIRIIKVYIHILLSTVYKRSLKGRSLKKWFLKK